VRPNNRLLVRSAVLALSLSVGFPTIAPAEPTNSVTSAAVTLQCASSAVVYRVLDNGDMLHYQHQEPENGVPTWAANPPTIGRAWFGKPVAAPDGVIYAPWDDGALRRYRWNGTAWDLFNGSFHEVVDPSGWERYLTGEYRNRITVDTEGHIYTVEPDGYLHWRAYDTATDTWTHRRIDSGWNQFNLIVAGGNGVIYARNTAGVLYRYKYHAASQRWLLYGRQVGHTWNIFDRVLSAGADVLYGIQPNGVMLWYRWDENTNAFVSLTGRQVGAGWIDRSTTAAPDSCKLVGSVVPTRPTVPATSMTPATLRYTTNGDVHYSYVDGEGRAVYGRATDLSGGTSFGFAAVPGFTGVTGITSTGEHQDGRVQLVTTGTDAEVRGNVQTVVRGPWSGTETVGGFVPGPATMARQADNTLAMFALDETFGLWARRQTAVNGPFQAWIPVGGTTLAHGPLTVVPITGGVRVLGLGRDGTFQTATYVNHALSAWTSLGGNGFGGSLSAVPMPDGTLQVFAAKAGTVYTQRQTSTGFPGTWTALPGLTVSGSPSAIMAPNGTLQVTARADDGYVYFTGQVTPGAGEYTPWREITNYADQSATEPTALAVPDENTWVIAFRNELDTPRLLRAQNPSARSAAGVTFTEVPLVPAPR
jgi:hypothetical protein